MLLIFGAGILWGTIGLFVNELNALGASGSLISFMRMFFALVVMTAAALAKHGRGIILRDKKALLFCALIGIISNGLFNIFYTTSIRLNGMGTASVLLYTAPVFTAIASRLLFHEKFTPLKVFALGLNIAGCILTVTGGDFSGSSVNILGVLAGLGSGFGYGMAAVFAKMAGKRTDALLVSVYGYLFAAVFLFMFARPEFAGGAKVAGLGFLYGLIPTAFAYLVYYIGLNKIRDTSRVPVIASIEPVTAIIIGAVVYGERIGTVNFIGVAVVLLSIIIMIKSE